MTCEDDCKSPYRALNPLILSIPRIRVNSYSRTTICT